VDSSEPSRETVLRRKEEERQSYLFSSHNIRFHFLEILQENDSVQREAAHLKTLDGQLEDVGRELGGLFEGEVAPVDDEDEAIDLELRVFNQNLQRKKDGPQDICE